MALPERIATLDDTEAPGRLGAQRFDSLGSTKTAVASEQGDNKVATRRDPFPRRPWRKKATPWAAILGHEYAGSGTAEDPYVVTWLEGDAENPHHYTFGYKWAITMMCGSACSGGADGSRARDAGDDDGQLDAVGGRREHQGGLSRVQQPGVHSW